MQIAPSPSATSHLRSGRSKASLIGILWNVGSIGVTTLLSALAFAFTSRVLGPAEFGAVALAASVVAIASSLVPLAFGEALIQRNDLRQAHLDSVFWLGFGSGMAVFLGLVAAAPLAVQLTGQPIIGTILPVLALRLPFEAMATVPNALISRQMDFRAFALRSMLASLLASVLCIVLLLMGFAIWALVISQLAGSLVASIASMLVARWWPGRMVEAAALRDLRSFGLFSMGGRLLNEARIDQFLLGALVGPAALGLFFFARRIYQLVIDLTSGAMMPVSNVLFASLQSELVKRREAYLTASFGATAVSLPLFGGCLAVAPTAVPLIFGPQWEPAVLMLQLLSVGGMMAGLGMIQSALIRNLGAPGWWFWYQAIGQGLNWLLIVVLAPWGVNVIVAAHLLRTLALWPLSIRKVERMLDLGWAEYLGSLAAPFVAMLVMIAAVMLLPTWLDGLPAGAVFGLQIATGVVVYLAVLTALAHRRLRAIWNTVRAAKRNRA